MISASTIWQMIASKMTIKKGYSVSVITDESNYFVCRLDLKSETLKSIQMVIESSNLPKKVRIEFTGSAPLETRPDLVQIHKVCSHSAGLLDRFIVEATNNIPSHSIGRRASDFDSTHDLGFSLERDERNNLNSSLKEQFSYSHSFNSVEGLVKSAIGVLKSFKIVLDEPISSHWLIQESGVIICQIAREGAEGTTAITSNNFVLTFHKDGDLGFVGKAYIS